MKIRYIFEPKDFYGLGQYLIRQSADGPGAQKGFKSSVFFKIGYLRTGALDLILLIWMSDGMCRAFDSKEALCKSLNDDPEGYRPARLDEILECMTDIGPRSSNPQN